MSEAVIITLITAVTGLLTTLLVKVSKVGKDAAVARDQTQNSHTEINLRDDIDGKHETVKDSLDLVIEMLKGLQVSDRNQWSAIEELRRGRR
jgi:hypothetical protein